MDRKEAAELLPIIKAFSEGKSIEFSSITDVSKAWREVTDFPLGMIDSFKFRIKPEPKYRPFKDKKECWQEMFKHQPFGWVKNKDTQSFFLCKAVGSFTSVGTDNSVYTYGEAFEFFTFTDGRPFGVKEE